MSFEKELEGLDVGLQDVYVSLEKLSGAGKNVSASMQASIRTFQAQSGKAKELAESYEKAVKASNDMLDATARNEKITYTLFKQYQNGIKSVKQLAYEYDKLAAVQKVLDVSSRGFFSNLQKGVEGLGKLGNGVVGLSAKLGGLTLSHSHLTTILLDYNKTQFEAMRIGERYGDSMTSHAQALDIVKEKTALSRQEFEELNLTLKESSVGIPMTSKAVAELAANMSGKFGYSAERVKKAITELLPLQNKMPDLFERIQKIQAEFNTNTTSATASAKSLRNEMRAVGASQSEIEKAMSSVSRVSEGTGGMNSFEESIAKSKRDIEDSALTMSDKMSPAIKTMAEWQAKAATSIAGMPASLMQGVGAFAMMGAGASSLLSTVMQISHQMRVWGGVGANMLSGQASSLFSGGSSGSGAGLSGYGGGSGGGFIAGQVRPNSMRDPGQFSTANSYVNTPSGPVPTSIFLREGEKTKDLFSRLRGSVRPNVAGEAQSAPKRGMGVSSGVMVGGAMLAMMGPMLAEYLDTQLDKNFVPKSEHDNTLAYGKAGTGFLGGATKWGGYGMMTGNPYIAAGAAIIGGGIGAYTGWQEGKQKSKEMFDASEAKKKEKAGLIAGTARRAGFEVSDGSSKKDVLDILKKSIKEAGDEQRVLNTLQDMYAAKQITFNNMQSVLNEKIKDSVEARKKAHELIRDSLGGVKEELWVQQQIERAMAGQLDALEAQLQVIGRIKEGGMQSMAGFIEGKVSSGTAATGGAAANVAAKEEVRAKEEKFVSKFIMTASDDKLLREKLISKEGLETINKAKAESQKIGEKREIAELERDKDLSVVDGVQNLNTSAEEKKRQKDVIEKKYADKMADIQEEDDANKKRQDEIISKIDLAKAGRVAREGTAQYSKAYAEAERTGTPEERKAARAQLGELPTLLADVDMAVSEQQDTSYTVATAEDQKNLRLIKMQSGLAEAKAAQAAKMGLPQSYEAQKNVIDLAQKQATAANLQKMHSEAAARSQGIKIEDVDLINKGEMTREQAVSNMMNTDKTLTMSTAEEKLNRALEERIRTSGEVVEADTKLAEAMKTWREGWMDAMDEMIIGAGDFTAVIGMGDKNVGEKTAAGGVSSFRHGGTNVANMNQSDLFAVRNQTATSFDIQQGQTYGTSATRTPGLSIYTDLYNKLNGDPAKAIQKAEIDAKAGRYPVKENINAATQAGAESAAENGLDGRSPNGPLTFPAGQALRDEEFLNASLMMVGSQQPGGDESDYSFEPHIKLRSFERTNQAVDDIGSRGTPSTKGGEPRQNVNVTVTMELSEAVDRLLKVDSSVVNNGSSPY